MVKGANIRKTVMKNCHGCTPAVRYSLPYFSRHCPGLCSSRCCSLQTPMLCPLASSFSLDSENEHFYQKEFHSSMSANLHLLVKLVCGTNTAAPILHHDLTPMSALGGLGNSKIKGKKCKHQLSISCPGDF